MCQMGEMPLKAEFVYGWGPCGDGEARRLFAGLRGLDEVGAAMIVCPANTCGGRRSDYARLVSRPQSNH